MITAPTFGPCCALCWERFKVGDTYRSIWPKRPASAVDLGISVHPACGAQLDDGDLTRIFSALERKLEVPIAVLNGRRVLV